MSSTTQDTAPARGASHDNSRTGVLENMSARPRTPIVRNIPALRTGWAVFTIDLSELTGGHLQVPRELVAKLDARWAELGFTGAALLRPIGPLEAAGVHPLPCPDRLLTLNILLRARGRLLLEGAPLLESLRDDELVAVASDDPLLVSAAHAHHKPANAAAVGAVVAGSAGTQAAAEQIGEDRDSAEDAPLDVQPEQRRGGLRRLSKIGRGGAR